jgi:hypothetical protein
MDSVEISTFYQQDNEEYHTQEEFIKYREFVDKVILAIRESQGETETENVGESTFDQNDGHVDQQNIAEDDQKINENVDQPEVSNQNEGAMEEEKKCVADEDLN